MSDPFTNLSIALELGVFILLALISIRRDMRYLGLSAAFLLFVFYDLARELAWSLPSIVTSLSLFIASWAALWSAWQLYRNKEPVLSEAAPAAPRSDNPLPPKAKSK